MKYEYTHFIHENIAPKGATRIVVKDGDRKEVCSIPASRFGSLTPPAGEPLYSFGLVSDCHTMHTATNWDGNRKLQNALAYFKAQGDTMVMVIGCGDFVQTGFYRQNESSTQSITIGDNVLPVRDPVVVQPREYYYDEAQMVKHSEIIKAAGIPVHELFGNHENYGVAITAETTINGVVYNSLARAKELTGIPATAYTVSNSPDSDETDGTTVRPNRRESVRDDLFILIGQSESSKPMSDSDLDWLENILNANSDRRCFVFIHSFIDDDWDDKTTERRDVERPAEDEDGYVLSDSGNPCGARGNAIVGWWEDHARSTLIDFLDTLKKYPNVIIFHGHSHMKFESQEFDECANYTDKNGFKSVHVPSLGSPRRLLNTDGDWDVVAPDRYTQPESQCYRVDVYEDYIVLNALSFSGATSSPVALGTYKIEV